MSSIVQEGYQQTEIGVIPSDWSVKKISDLAQVIRGASPRPKGDKRYYGGSVPRLMVQDVTRDGMYVTPQIDFLTEAGKKLSRPCEAGTLTLVCSGTVGVPSILAVDACIHDGFLALIKLVKGIDRDYLYQFFKTQQEKFDNSATHGGVFTNLTTDGVREFLVPVPSQLKEQTAIANALSDVDALITSLEKLIAKKRAIKTAAMQQLLTGKKRLPPFDQAHTGYKQTDLGEIPEDWAVAKVGEKCNLLTGFPFPSSKYSESGVKLLRGSNVKRGVTDWSEGITQYWPALTADIRHYELKDKDIVISMDGSLVGRSFAQLSKADLPAILLQRVARLRSNEVEVDYLKEWVCSNYFTDHCDSVKTTTAIPHISPDDIRNFRFLAPATKKEQQKIANALSDMYNEIECLYVRLTKTQQLKKGMMQELLTGRTRLV